MIDSFSANYRFLSNFYTEPGTISVEHIYQAMKTSDPLQQVIVLSAGTPAQAKKLGRRVKLRKDWDEIKHDVMEQALRCKFAPDTFLWRLLKATGDHELVEGNYWGDTYWGVCNGKGENHLGKLLMKIRDEVS